MARLLTSFLAGWIFVAQARPAEAKCGSMVLNLKLDQRNLTVRVQSSDGFGAGGMSWTDTPGGQRN
jgi:hypothetical protein